MWAKALGEAIAVNSELRQEASARQKDEHFEVIVPWLVDPIRVRRLGRPAPADDEQTLVRVSSPSMSVHASGVVVMKLLQSKANTSVGYTTSLLIPYLKCAL